jgi:hypothetical protein
MAERKQVPFWRDKELWYSLKGRQVISENPGRRVSVFGHSWSNPKNPSAPPEPNTSVLKHTDRSNGNGQNQVSLESEIVFQSEANITPEPSKN